MRLTSNGHTPIAKSEYYLHDLLSHWIPGALQSLQLTHLRKNLAGVFIQLTTEFPELLESNAKTEDIVAKLSMFFEAIDMGPLNFCRLFAYGNRLLGAVDFLTQNSKLEFAIRYRAMQLIGPDQISIYLGSPSKDSDPTERLRDLCDTRWKELSARP